MLPREAALGLRAARPAARSLILPLAAAALLAAGCGGDDEEGDAGDGGAGSELSVVLDPDGPGGAASRRAEVACGAGPGCEALERLTPGDFAPTPPDTACTEIYGGPDVVTVTGTIDGQPVAAELTRADGCQIERFDRFVPLLRELFDGYRPGAALAP